MKIAFVAPFFGAKASGGAEAECRHTALRIAEMSGVDVDILTTCLKDLPHGLTNNFHSAGVSQDGLLTVRRFEAEAPDMSSFGCLNTFIINGGRPTPQEELQFISRHVNSIGLYRYIADNSDDYDWFCFVPYLFGTTCFGSQIVPHKSVLIPCLHDEGYARMQPVRDLFERVARIAFHTPAEMVLAEKLYGPARSSGQRLLIGEGIETRFESEPDRFREKFGIKEPFIFYAGRKDETKNVPELIKYYSNYKRNNSSDLKLILVGPREAVIPSDMKNDIIDLGFVSDQDKKDAYSAAMVLCQPSLNESFSIVMMESWVCGRPCLVHSGCGVTREHIERSGGGLYFESYSEFASAVDYFAENPEMCKRMGQAGKEFVNENFEWSVVIDRYLNVAFAKS